MYRYTYEVSIPTDGPVADSIQVSVKAREETKAKLAVEAMYKVHKGITVTLLKVDEL